MERQTLARVKCCRLRPVLQYLRDMRRVLITDYVHPLLITGLRRLGYTVQYMPEIERPEVLEWIDGFTGIVINTRTVADRMLMECDPALLWIARLGSGLDIVDLDAARDRGIVVINTPEANATAVAEHVFGMLLSLLRNICAAHREMHEGLWLRERNRGVELGGRTVGIIGFGNTGSAFASKFSGWNVTVLAYDKYKSAYATYLPYVQECASIDEVIAQSDIVSLHLPLTPETYHLVNAQFISCCKPGAILINSARGKIMDTGAVVEALAEGQLKGACLDVFENEKPASFSEKERECFDRLMMMDNVVLTPHIAGWTFESRERIARRVLELVESTGVHLTGT